MKILLIAVASLLCMGNLFAQEEAVPKHVIKEFKQLFKSSESPTWYVEPQYYEVQFLQEKHEKIASFSKSDGKLIETKELIEETEIPGEVIQVVRNNYPDYVLEDYFRIVRVDQETIFKINIKSSAGIFSLDVSPQGEIISTTKVQ